MRECGAEWVVVFTWKQEPLSFLEVHEAEGAARVLQRTPGPGEMWVGF